MGLYQYIGNYQFQQKLEEPNFWWYAILGIFILIVIPYMIYYIHITIDYIDSSIHLVTLPEYRKVILWYTK